MCGIVGAFSFESDGRPVDLEVVKRIDEMQRNRGPDGKGLWQSHNLRVALAHRRLAIIDTGQSGAQPMADITGRWTITFNGEIYNYRELRVELENAGIRFLTNSDTEVLINTVAVWGEPGLSKLRGMFAFALWDAQEQELWLVRDPYGIKPLYIAEAHGVLWFSSQARALAKHAPIDTSRDPAGLVGLYLWGNIPEPFTWWRGISPLRAGHLRRIRMGVKLQPSRPFCALEKIFVSNATESITDEALRSTLLESVNHHLVADVPVGIFLSAGVDSSVIASLASETHSNLQTVTLAFKDYAGSPNDEAPQAEITAKAIGTRHTTITIDQEMFFSLYEDFFEAMDQPSIDGLNVFLISHAASAMGLKVVLAGLGGDEIFGGYPSFRDIPNLLKIGKLISVDSKIIDIFEKCLRTIFPPNFSPKFTAALSSARGLSESYLLRRCLHVPFELDSLLDLSWIKSGIDRLQTSHALQSTISALSKADRSVYTQIAALESCWYMRNQLLRDADWASMAHGLELRLPLADKMLLEKLAPAINSAMPPRKIDLSRCARNIPTSVTARRKTGFSTPIRSWIEAEMRHSARGLRPWSYEVHRRFKLN